ncbi:MAG: SCO1664 family protein [Actinomycetota bacterium]
MPPTILRDGPLGIGAVQQFIEHDPAVTAFDLADDHRRELMQIALFDVIVNNADRKAGHVLIDVQGSIWGIDHGLCFHEEPKLRTVLWDFIGEPIPEQDLLAVEGLLRALEGDLGLSLRSLLEPAELEALERRVRSVVDNKVFPRPGPGRPYPWPPI